MGKTVNPLQWRREHQLAAIVIVALGGLLGLLFAWIESPAHRTAALLRLSQSQAFLVWLPHIDSYWHLPASGAATAGLAFYALMLLKRAS